MKDGLHRMFNSRELASGIVWGSCAMQEGGFPQWCALASLRIDDYASE